MTEKPTGHTRQGNLLLLKMFINLVLMTMWSISVLENDVNKWHMDNGEH